MECSKTCRSLLVSATLLGAAFAAEAAETDTFEVVEMQTAELGGLRRTQWTVRASTNTSHPFGLVRVVKSGSHATTPIILLPALGTGSDMYMAGDISAEDDFAHSIAAELAKKGLDVFVYNPREAYLPLDGACPTGDCDWGIQRRLDDLVFVRAVVARYHGNRTPYLGGLSLGAMTTIAAINELPAAYAGAIIWDGSLAPIPSSQLRTDYAGLCAYYRSAVDSGSFFDGQFIPFEQLLAELSASNPTGLSPIPLFPTGTSNRQAYLGFFTGPLAGPAGGTLLPPGAVFFDGSVQEDRLYHASEDRWLAILRGSTTFFSNAEARDISCGWAGDTTFTANLHNATNPILVLEEGRGIGALVENDIALFGSSDIEVVYHLDFGHADLLAHPKHKRLLEKLIVDWIKRHQH